MNNLIIPGIKIFIVILILVSAPAVYSQEKNAASIYGKIKDQQTGEPIENVNVYIANSLYGTTTDIDGNFKIDNLPAGLYKLIVSHVSYYMEEEEIDLNDKNTLNYEFQLIEKAFELPQLSVEAEEDDEWEDMFEIFSENLIGQTKNSENTTILNRYVINLQYVEEGVLTASSDVPLIIENKALGYKISYFLNLFKHTDENTQFSGMPFFEEMEPEDSVQKKEWEENRLRTYSGSKRHFLTAICNNKKAAGKFDNIRVISEYVSEILYHNDPDDIEGRFLTYSDSLYMVKQGFNVIQLSELDYQPSHSPFMSLVNTNMILFNGKNETEYVLEFPKYLQIVYDKEREEQQFLASQGKYTIKPEKQVSAIALNAPSVTIDHKGRNFGEFDLLTFGYWTFERLADMLPGEYEVPDSVLISFDAY